MKLSWTACLSIVAGAAVAASACGSGSNRPDVPPPPSSTIAPPPARPLPPEPRETKALPLKSPTPTVPKPGVCLNEAAKLIRSQPVQIGKVVRAPKKIKNVSPDWPELPRSTSIGGVWVGEVLIDDKGRVAEVWPTRPFRLEPPFPAFNDAVVAAIRQWLFEPLLLDKKAVPVCMTVTVNINLQ